MSFKDDGTSRERVVISSHEGTHEYFQDKKRNIIDNKHCG
jgi:hypothetical protein